MKNWFGRLFGYGSKRITQQIAETESVQKIVQNIETKTEPVMTKIRSNAPSLGSTLSYGKWYYGVDAKAKPIICKTIYGIEKKYPCNDGGELVVSYYKRTDGSSHLDITKVGNPNDINVGGWYRGFYSDMAVKHYTDRFGDNITKTIKKKGGRKQVLSTRNGQSTEEVHVPLKRWQITENMFGKTKENSNIISDNPRDFDRFID